MVETTFGIVVILGVLFLFCKIINKIARVCGIKDVMDVIGESLTVGSGSFPSNREER